MTDFTGGEFPASAFSEAHNAGSPDLAQTLQFIANSVLAAEQGAHDAVQGELLRHPDRIFSRNIALYLSGVTKDRRYLELADSMEIDPSTLEMSDVGKLALGTYFGVQPKPTVENQKAPDNAPTHEELIDSVRTEVWCNLSSLRVIVQSSSGEALLLAKTHFDKEVAASVRKLVAVQDVAMARELATGTLTRDGQLAVQTEYDQAILDLVRKASSAEALLQTRQALGTLFTAYHKTNAADVYDNKIIDIITGSEPSDSNIRKAIDLSTSCAGRLGVSMTKVHCDNLILRGIANKLRLAETGEAMRLTNLLRTEHAKAKATELIMSQL